MVMPLYDDNPFKLPQIPVVSWSLIGVTIVAFIIEFSANDNPIVVANQFGVIPAAVSGAYSFPGAISPLLTLITYQFLHADIVHLIGNLIFVWVFADNVEQALGRWRFLAFYLLVGAIGGLAFVFDADHAYAREYFRCVTKEGLLVWIFRNANARRSGRASGRVREGTAVATPVELGTGGNVRP